MFDQNVMEAFSSRCVRSRVIGHDNAKWIQAKKYLHPHIVIKTEENSYASWIKSLNATFSLWPFGDWLYFWLRFMQKRNRFQFRNGCSFQSCVENVKIGPNQRLQNAELEKQCTVRWHLEVGRLLCLDRTVLYMKGVDGRSLSMGRKCRLKLNTTACFRYKA